MNFRPAADMGSQLTERWHDQTLDLKSLRFDAPESRCVFAVTERVNDLSASRRRFLENRALQRCWVTVQNVADVRIIDAEGEVQLYINRVQTARDLIRVTCANGTVELVGEELALGFELTPAKDIEIALATPIGEISWRRQRRKAQ